MERNPYATICRFLPIEDIKRIIANSSVKVISFDVFDTLLVRPSMLPRDIFYLLDLRFPKSPKKFSELRLSAEERMGSQNATLSEIWSFILKSDRISLELAETMLQEEIKLETQLLTIRQDVREIYQFALEHGKKVIAVSDMYLPLDTMKKILHMKGYTAIEQVYVSCEYKKRKDSGELYDVVLKEEAVTVPSEMVHIGDNYQSDFRIPLEKGITAIYYPSIWNIMLSETSFWKKAFSNPHISEDPFTRILYSYTFLYAYNAGYRPNEENCFGTIQRFAQLYLAPLLTSIALDILNHKIIQSEYQKIFFGARDGYLPLMVYQELANCSTAIPASYLYVSRSSLSYGQYKDFFDFFDHFEPDTSYKLRDFVKYFVIDQILREKILGNLTDSEANYDLQKDVLSARRVLLRFKHDLNKYFVEQQALAERYYKNVFCGAGKRQLVFDCGYSGSISVGLMSTCKTLSVDKYYLWQMEKNIERDKENNTKTFCRFQTNVPFGINLIIEECFSPAQGTHIGFIEEDDIIPVQEEFIYSEKLQHDLELIEKCTLEYAKCFSEMFCGYLNEFPIGNDDVFSIIGNLAFLRSTEAELQIFENFKFPDRYTRGETTSLSKKIQDFYDTSMNYPTSFSGTGFLLKENYAQIPSRILSSRARSLKLGIHVHLYNKHLFPEIYGYLKEFPMPFDLFLTVTDEKFIPVAEKIFNSDSMPNLKHLKILLVENRGRDVAPWVVDTMEYQKNYDLFCHLHGKESPQNGKAVGDGWRDYLFINLLHKQAVVDILNLFAENDQLGVVFPEPYTQIADIFNYGRLKLLGTMGEDQTVLDLLSQMGLSSHVERHIIMYSVGTMMWYRPAALCPLFDLGLKSEDFPEEPIGVGGTIAHAIERLPPLVAHGIGYKSMFFTEFPLEHRNWMDRQIESFETMGGTSAPTTNVGLKGALKIFVHKHIPFLFRDSVEIYYQNPIGIRGALANYLSKLAHRLLRA